MPKGIPLLFCFSDFIDESVDISDDLSFLHWGEVLGIFIEESQLSLGLLELILKLQEFL